MSNHLVDFKNMEWINASIGARYKSFVSGNQQIRLIEFSEGFVEPDWCLHGHAGYVLDGEFTLDFNGNLERFVKGDIIFIPIGEVDKHKAVLGKGEKITLILFETL